MAEKAAAHLVTYRTKEQVVYTALREQIITGELKPGGRISLRELAAKFGVSEIPVREALKRLEASGLVVHEPHRGWRVSVLTRQEYEETAEIRMLLEVEAAVRSVTRITEEGIQKLEAYLDLMERAVGHDHIAYKEAHQEFHFTLYRFCGNSHLVRLVEELWRVADRYAVVFDVFPEHTMRALAEHREILKHVKARDVASVKEAVENHRRAAFQGVLKLLDLMGR